MIRKLNLGRFSCRSLKLLCVHTAWVSGQRCDPYVLCACPFSFACRPSLELLWHRNFPVRQVVFSHVHFGGSGFIWFTSVPLHFLGLRLMIVRWSWQVRWALSSAGCSCQAPDGQAARKGRFCKFSRIIVFVRLLCA